MWTKVRYTKRIRSPNDRIEMTMLDAHASSDDDVACMTSEH